jgi:predicted SAM-dependent methyltransferase
MSSSSPGRSGGGALWYGRPTVLGFVGIAVMALTATLVVQQVLQNTNNDRDTVNRNISYTDTNNLRSSYTTVAVVSENNPCAPTPNRTVMDVEDLELSCEHFRVQEKPSLEDVFAYLGPEELKTAWRLKKQIDEWQLPQLRIDLGAGTSADKEGVLPTDFPVVDILNQTKLAALFTEGSVAALRASHVFEHLTYPQAIVAFQNIRCLLDRDVGLARIATPDAQHPGLDYHEKKLKADWPSGIFKAQYRDDIYPGHRALWSESKMAVAASLAGLNARPLEWWSSSSTTTTTTGRQHRIEEAQFCEQVYDGANGFSIGRSAHRDKRNRDKPLTYTSLIMDVMPQTLNDWTASRS